MPVHQCLLEMTDKTDGRIEVSVSLQRALLRLHHIVKSNISQPESL